MGAAWIYSVAVTLAPQLFPAGTAEPFWDVIAVVTGLVVLGQALEMRARGRTSQAVKRLVGLKPKTARVVRDGQEIDVPLADVIDIAFRARPCAIALEAANPRHAHEWSLFEKLRLPEGKVIIAGVIESKSNFIEHPELIAQRIGRYANLVGRENVMAGSDCGFGTWVGQAAVDPDVVWAKLAAMAEGARIASRTFWR
jgi:hypothetical protein